MRRLLALAGQFLALARGAPTAPARAEGASLSASPASVSQKSSVTISLAGFAPKEVISLWLTLPDGSVESLSAGRSEDGTFQVDVALPTGTHYLSAYGQRSGERAVAPLELLPGDGG